MKTTKRLGLISADGLREEGHSVDLFANGSEGSDSGQYWANTTSWLWIGCYRASSVSLVKTLRGTKNTPVLFLTSLGGVDDRIEGLNAGGDDYLVKPFAFGELSARIAALGRRPQMQDEPVALKAGDLEMNLLTRKVTRAAPIIAAANLRCSSICASKVGSRPARC